MRFLVPFGALGVMSCDMGVVFPHDEDSAIEETDSGTDGLVCLGEPFCGTCGEESSSDPCVPYYPLECENVCLAFSSCVVVDGGCGWVVDNQAARDACLADCGGGTTTPTVPEHVVVPADQLCWDCHEADRKTPTHYGDPDITLRWDCGPCHTTVDWSDATLIHPVQVPHGTLNNFVPTAQADWVVACADCHTALPATDFDCVSCHAAIQPHFGAGNDTCLACHPTAGI